MVEPPTDSSNSTDALSLEQRLESTAVALKRFLPEVEQRSKGLNFSPDAILEGVHRFFGQITMWRRVAGLSRNGPNARSTTVPADVSQRRLARPRDIVEPPRPTYPFNLSHLPLVLTYSIGEVWFLPTQSNGAGEAHQCPPPTTFALPSPRIGPLTFRLKRKKMTRYCKFGSLGVMEGEFSEPSGMAINSENDIVVADPDKRYIRIFDREARFKCQFGEVGRADGQLLFFHS